MKLLKDGFLLRDDYVVEINADVVYPNFMTELGLTEDKLDQYWLETMFQCAKLEAQRLTVGTPADRSQDGIPLQIHIFSGADKSRWQVRRFPAGRGIRLATKGGEAKGHFKRIRGIA